MFRYEIESMELMVLSLHVSSNNNVKQIILCQVDNPDVSVTTDCGCRCSYCLQIVVALRKKNVLIFTVTEDKMTLKKEINTQESALALVR